MKSIILGAVFLCFLVTVDAAGLDEDCTATADCTVTGSDCLPDVCKCKADFTKSGATCLANGQIGAACKADGSCTDTTLAVCESSKCKIKAGATCPASSPNCVLHSQCSAKCTCDTGYTETSTGLCNGVAPQSVSSWLLIGSIITLLVTFSLP